MAEPEHGCLSGSVIIRALALPSVRITQEEAHLGQVRSLPVTVKFSAGQGQASGREVSCHEEAVKSRGAARNSCCQLSGHPTRDLCKLRRLGYLRSTMSIHFTAEK